MINKYADALYRSISTIADNAVEEARRASPEYFAAKVIDVLNENTQNNVYILEPFGWTNMISAQGDKGYPIGSEVQVQRYEGKYTIKGSLEVTTNNQSFFDFYFEQNNFFYSNGYKNIQQANNQITNGGDLIYFQSQINSDFATDKLEIRFGTFGYTLSIDDIDGNPESYGDDIFYYKFVIPKGETINEVELRGDETPFINITMWIGKSDNMPFGASFDQLVAGQNANYMVTYTLAYTSINHPKNSVTGDPITTEATMVDMQITRKIPTGYSYAPLLYVQGKHNNTNVGDPQPCRFLDSNTQTLQFSSEELTFTSFIIYYELNQAQTVLVDGMGDRTDEVLFNVTINGYSFPNAVLPSKTGEFDLGSSNLRWRQVYTTNGVVQISARKNKECIEPFGEKQDILFDNLKPCSFEFVSPKADRRHYGFILDEIRDAMDAAGISPLDFGAYCLVNKAKPDGDGGLRYSEFIPLVIWEAQKLKTRVGELEAQIQELKNIIQQQQQQQ